MDPITKTKVDVILTSYNRFDLLRKTLDTFLGFNTHDIGKFIVRDDYSHMQRTAEELRECKRIMDDYHGIVEFHWTDWRQGQIKSLDSLWEATDAPYVFCLEDDWEFYREGFIEESLEIMLANPMCIQVWLRETWDTNKHPLEPQDGLLRLRVNHNGLWNGFSFNPGLKRREDYAKLGSYSKHTTFQPTRPWESEVHIGRLYAKLGYWACITPHGFVRHTGDARGIRS